MSKFNCWKLFKILKPHVQLILDDEKYFSLTEDISCNRKYYTTDLFTTLIEVKSKTKMKFKPKLLVWMAASQKALSAIYIHRSAKDILIRKRILPFIKHHHKGDSVLFWPNSCVITLIKTSSWFFHDKPDQFCTTSTKHSQCSSDTSNCNSLVITRTEGVLRGLGSKKFESIGKKDSFEGKIIGSKRGNTYDFRCSKIYKDRVY